MALSQAAQDLLNQLAAAPGTFIEQQQIAGPALDELMAANLAAPFGPSLQVAYVSFFRPQGPQHVFWPVGLTYNGKVQAGLPVPASPSEEEGSMRAPGL